MPRVERGDKLAVVDKKGRVQYYVYFWGVDKDDPLRWVLVLFRGTHHLARLNPRWLRRAPK